MNKMGEQFRLNVIFYEGDEALIETIRNEESFIPYIKRLLWLYREFEDVFVKECSFSNWIKERRIKELGTKRKSSATYSFATNISKDLELLERARNKSEFIKYLIANETLILSQLYLAYTQAPLRSVPGVSQNESEGNIPEEPQVPVVQEERVIQAPKQEVQREEPKVIPVKEKSDEKFEKNRQAARAMFGNSFM